MDTAVAGAVDLGRYGRRIVRMIVGSRAHQRPDPPTSRRGAWAPRTCWTRAGTTRRPSARRPPPRRRQTRPRPPSRPATQAPDTPPDSVSSSFSSSLAYEDGGEDGGWPAAFLTTSSRGYG